MILDRHLTRLQQEATNIVVTNRNFGGGAINHWREAAEYAAACIPIEFFQLEGTTQCKYDYMMVKSSLTDSSPPDGSFCGDEKPSAYTSESHSLQLIFHTDDSIEKKVS